MNTFNGHRAMIEAAEREILTPTQQAALDAFRQTRMAKEYFYGTFWIAMVDREQQDTRPAQRAGDIIVQLSAGVTSWEVNIGGSEPPPTLPLPPEQHRQ